MGKRLPRFIPLTNLRKKSEKIFWKSTKNHQKMSKYKNRHYRKCPRCGEMSPALRKKCPNCGFYLQKISRKLRKEKQRKTIVSLMETGEFTLREVGEVFGITRERVRQVYFEETGKRAAPLRKARTRRKIKERLNEIRFHCRGCGKPVKRKDGYRKWWYCKECSRIMMAKRRDIRVVRYCKMCGASFYPHLNFKAPSIRTRSRTGIFCSRECCFNYRRMFGKPPFLVKHPPDAEGIRKQLTDSGVGKFFTVTDFQKTFSYKTPHGAWMALRRLQEKGTIAIVGKDASRNLYKVRY